MWTPNETGEQIVERMRNIAPTSKQKYWHPPVFAFLIVMGVFVGIFMITAIVISIQQSNRRAAACHARKMETIEIGRAGTFCIDDQRRVIAP